MPRKVDWERYAAIDLTFAPRTSNEFTARSAGRTTQDVRAGLEYRFLGRNFAEFEYRRFDFTHDADQAAIAGGMPCVNGSAGAPAPGDPGCVTSIGGQRSAYVPAGHLGEDQFELHTSVVGTGHVYLASSLIRRRTSYGYPSLSSPFGLGVQLLPALERPASVSASYYYYPELSGTYAPPIGPSQKLRYKLQTFSFGAQLAVPNAREFLELGFYGDHYLGKQNAPGNAVHRVVQIGVGLRL